MTDLDDLLLREGAPTDDPNDKGGPTAYGISKASNPQAWADGKVTEEEARAIYIAKYVQGPRFDQVVDLKLQAQLIDFGVTSGPMVAIMKLQAILKVPVDGIIGPATLAALTAADAHSINNLLVAARVRMIGQIVAKNPSQLTYLNGWLNRTLEFLT